MYGSAAFLCCINFSSFGTEYFVGGFQPGIWNIPPRFCIIKQKYTALPSTGSAQMRFCWPASVSQSAARRRQTCVRAAASSASSGTTGGIAAPAPPSSCSPRPVRSCSRPSQSRASATSRRTSPTCALSGRERCLRLQSALFCRRAPERQCRPGHGPPRDGLHPRGRLRLRLPSAEGRRQACALPPARAAGRGAGGAAGAPSRAEAAGFRKEPARRRTVALPRGGPEEPPHRSAHRAGCAHHRWRGPLRPFFGRIRGTTLRAGSAD